MLRILPFKNFGDYSDTNLPSAIFAPRLRDAHAKIHAADPACDHSFSIVTSNETLANCLLYVDKQKEIPCIWGLGGPATFWLTDRCTAELRHDVFKYATSQFKNILAEFSEMAISYADYFNDGILTSPAAYLMQQYNCSASVSFSNVIDLTISQEILRHGLRDSYKSLINRGLKKYTLVCIDGTDVQPCHIAALHQCHVTASGRDVYSSLFWDIWLNECQANAAYLVLALKDGTAKGAILCTQVQGSVYYAIGAFDRSLEKTGLSHACLWEAIRHAKHRGVNEFEVGMTYFDCLRSDASAKEKNIGFFKRGFGGLNRPVLCLNATAKIL